MRWGQRPYPASSPSKAWRTPHVEQPKPTKWIASIVVIIFVGAGAIARVHAKIEALHFEVSSLQDHIAGMHEPTPSGSCDDSLRHLKMLEARRRGEWRGLSVRNAIPYEVKWWMTLDGQTLWQNRTLAAPKLGNGRAKASQVQSAEVLRALRFDNGRPVWDAALLASMRFLIETGKSLSTADLPHSAEDLDVMLSYVRRDKRVRDAAVIAGLTPWAELGVWKRLGRQLNVVTLSPYALPVVANDTAGYPLKAWSHQDLVDNYAAKGPLFDLVVSYSAVEHDGLGRFGDPIHPEGDLAAMDELYLMLRPGGLLLLAVPIGPQDNIAFHLHRVYGPKRLPLLLANFHVKARVFRGSLLTRDPLDGIFDLPRQHPGLDDAQYQPLLLLEPRHEPGRIAVL